jgi:hypothetical protein
MWVYAISDRQASWFIGSKKEIQIQIKMFRLKFDPIPLGSLVAIHK